MPTLVRFAAAGAGAAAGESSSDSDDTTMDMEENSAAGDRKNESEALDTSVNMLLDDTIDSGSDCDSTASEATWNKAKPNEKRATSWKNETDEKVENSSREDKEDKNDETRLSHSDSDSSLDTPPRSKKEDKQRSSGYQTNNQGSRYVRHDHAKQQPTTNIEDNDETRLSDSDSSLDTPPRRRNPTKKQSESQPRQPKTDFLPNEDNDETRMSDSNLDSSRETRQSRSPSHRASSTNLEKKGRSPQREQYAKQPRPAPQDLEWRQQKESNDFKSKFKHKVADFEQRNPRVRLRDYQSLSSEAQGAEQQRVMNLLHRLGIRRKSPDDTPMEPNPDDTDLDRTCLQDHDISTMTTNSPTQTSNRSANQKQSTSQTRNKRSQTNSNSVRMSQQQGGSLAAVRLSPIAKDSPNHTSFCNNSGARFSPESPVLRKRSEMLAERRSSGSELSIEITRGADRSTSFSPPVYESPELQISDRSNSKRLASTSGKRGKDSFRVKLNEPPHAYSSDSDSEALPPPAPSWHSSDDSISLVSAHGHDEHHGDQDHPFTASQSPIAGSARNPDHRSQHTGTHSQSHRSAYWSGGNRQDSRRERHRSCETSRHDVSPRREDKYAVRERSQHRSTQRDSRYDYRYDDTIDTVNATALRGPEGRTRLRDTTNVALKEGMPFHYNPLLIKRSKRTTQMERTRRDYPTFATADFRDPLGDYVGGEGEQLYHVFEWLVDRDSAGRAGSPRGAKSSSDSKDSKGIVFSLETEQYVNVLIKLLMEQESQSLGREERFDDVSSLSGDTLLVVKSKDDIPLWERALREHTPFSVLCHATLPSNERRRPATASKCATFDVVISTYDAMKSADSTVQLDDSGHVMLGQEAQSQAMGGWMTKRSTGASQRLGGFSQRVGGASQRIGSSHQRVDPAAQCKQLSVLHRVQWRRIIFNDELGRKCYVAKSGTARADAVAAVNAHARFIFFTKQKVESKKKEERELSGFESLMRSDRRALQTVTKVLRIVTDDSDDDSEDEDDALNDIMLDPAEGI